MTHEIDDLDRADLLHLCRMILQQYPLPRVCREDLQAVECLRDLHPKRSIPRWQHTRRASGPLEDWFRDEVSLAQHLQEWSAATQGRILLFHDAAYPELLRQIANPPVALFCEGSVAGLDDTAIAIVGSRSASQRACRFTRQLAADLAQVGVVVVSGLARGIDAAAHEGAREVGGRTVAVVGNGTDVCYPPEHAVLQEHIRRCGCVLSELPPGTAPRSWHFPSRNRILAGLVRGVVVVQAEQRSGALITARYALEENREVMAVPGDAEDVRSRGAHALLRQGAALVECAADVLGSIGWEQTHATGSEVDHQALLSLLRQPRTAESLRASLGWKVHEVQVCLAELELLGWVERDARGRFRRRNPRTP